MPYNLKNGDLVICSDKIKKKILKKISSERIFLNIKFMSLREFCDNYFDTYDKKSIYYLMKEFNLNYDVAREYLENIFFGLEELKVYYDFLASKELIVENFLFKKSLNNIVVIGYDISPYMKKELNKYNTRYIKNTKGSLKPIVYGFDNQTDEIVFVASSIVSKLENININDICLLDVNDEYKSEIKRIFDLFNLPINKNVSKSIYGTEKVQVFLSKLKECRDIKESLDSIDQGDIYNRIVDILNKYAFVESVDDVYIEIITNELKEAYIKTEVYKNAINFVSMDEIEEGKYYYLLGFNQDRYPKIYKDDEFISDKERDKMGLFTSFMKYKNNKNNIINVITSYPNIIISYKLKDNYSTYYPSGLIEELNLEVKTNEKVLPIYSNLYNKQKLSILLDKFYKFNEVSEELLLLSSNYDIPYLTYNNSYTGGNFTALNKYLNGKINLSYSSVNNYFLCAFRFYVENILKLNSSSENFMTMIGSLFHLCLSHMYDCDFDLEMIYNNYLKDKHLSNKEKFFASKLYKNLEFTIDTIRLQEKYSSFNEVMCEKKFSVDKSSMLKINFVGIVDKIKYMKKENKTLVAIIDYKTGFVETKLDNINYGLHMQLPVYIYLTKNGMHKNVQVVGFYLQKILNSVDMDSDDIEISNKKKLKLDGYTISNEKLINLFDSSYNKSEVIKGMSTTKSGFSSYTRLIDNDDIDTIVSLVSDKIDEVISALENVSFPINPKRMDNKLIGCEYCKFKDLCFKKEEDIVNLKNIKFEDYVGDKYA